LVDSCPYTALHASVAHRLDRTTGTCLLLQIRKLPWRVSPRPCLLPWSRSSCVLVFLAHSWSPAAPGSRVLIVEVSSRGFPCGGGVMAAYPKQSCDRWLARIQQSGCSFSLRLFAAGPMSRHSQKIVAGVHGGVDFFLTTHPTSRQESLYALQPNHRRPQPLTSSINQLLTIQMSPSPAFAFRAQYDLQPCCSAAFVPHQASPRLLVCSVSNRLTHRRNAPLP
jgi:hypothetical protein